MAFILPIYLLLFGGMQLYIFLKMLAAFPRLGHWSAIPGAALLVLLVAPLLGWWADHAGHDSLARPLLGAGFVWLVISGWSFMLFVGTDVWDLLVRLAGKWLPWASRLGLAPRTVFLAVAVIVAAGVVWGLIEAANIRVREVTVATPRLAPGSAPIRIVQITDMHLGLVIGEQRLRKVVGLIERLHPDVIVSTGDLVDSGLDRVEDLAPILAELKAPLGKFAVTGNHEFYAGLDRSIAFHEACGLRMLREESAVVGGRLRIAGVDDPAGLPVGMGRLSRLNEDATLPKPGLSADASAKAGGDGFTLFLKHRPEANPRSLGRFDLQLSGHVHGGQVFPFWYFVRLFYPLTPGEHALAEGSRIYVSRGTGTWGPPIRVGAPPEITLIVLTPEEP